MTLHDHLRDDLAQAMRSGEAARRDTLRLLLAAIKQTEVDSRVTLDDAGVEAVLRKQAKQRQESIADYSKAGRNDLVSAEKAELAIIESYLPQMLGRVEIEALASEVISELGASGPQAMGQVMARLMPEVKGRADGRLVNEVVRGLLLS
jgi:uncharacterized protein YqeY